MPPQLGEEILYLGARVTITEVGPTVRAENTSQVIARNAARAEETALRRELVYGKPTERRKEEIRDALEVHEIPPADRLNVNPAMLEWSEPDNAWIVKE